MSPIKHRPEIDGLRALAILPVIAFHLGAKWLPGGFVGVDVFFVISGYLITSIVLKEHGASAFSFRIFWMRRIRRILPAMLLMLTATLVAGYFILFSANWASLGKQSISTVTVSANLLMWHLTHDYWGPLAETIPLLHTWTLSVEEQFYLFFPVFIVVCLKWCPEKLLLCLAAIFMLSYASCVILTFKYHSAAFYFLPTRAWELTGGCFLAALAYKKRFQQERPLCLGNEYSAAIHRWLAMFGIALIGMSFFFLNGTGFPGYKALMPVAGSMLFIQFAGGQGCPATCLLSYPPVRFVGIISYSLYLWHWPVIVLGRAAQVRWEAFPTWAYITLIPVLALAAFYLVEQPSRRLPNILPRVITGSGLVICISICLVFFKPSYNLSAFTPTVWMGNAYNVAPRQIELGSTTERMEGIIRPERNPEYTNAYIQGGIIKRYGGQSVDILIIGDSHALMWAPVIDEICQEAHLTISFYTADGIPPFPAIPPIKETTTAFSPDEWFVFDSNRINLIKKWQPRMVIVAGRWSVFSFEDDINRFLEEVSKQGSKVLFIGDPPELAIGDINAPKFVSATSSITIKAHNLPGLQDSCVRMRSLSDRFKCVHVVETSDLYLTNGDRATVRNGNSILYIDDDHLSLAGARLAKERIKTNMFDILQVTPD